MDASQLLMYDIPNKNIRVFKFTDKPVYLLCQKQEQKKTWWVVSREGILLFKTGMDAFNTFTKAIKVSKTMRFIRKSSYAKIANSSQSRVANIIKKAGIDYSNDSWIADPEALVVKADRDYWSITHSGNYAARLFDETQFPLNI